MHKILLFATLRISMFDPVSAFPNFPEIEEKILHYWKKNRIFEKSVEKNPASKKWTFLDGPPFITGLPHYGTLLSSIVKDVFPRFWTMKGYRVDRLWGWDCHGLPAVNKVENKLHIKRKKDIEDKVGIERFIKECKFYVSEVSSEWEWYVDHIGRWVDFKNAYKTMNFDYMETVMWMFKQMYEKGYIYKGLRVSLYCPHCVTPISNFEVAMDADNYISVTEPSNIYKYKLAGEKNTYFLAWSTTPWNKLVTTALAVNPQLDYVKVKQGNEYYILAASTTKMLQGPFSIEQTYKGEKLLSMKYEPHFSFFPREKNKKSFVVVGGEFVTAGEGTGIVTIAPYGEEDLAVMKKEHIQVVLHVDEEGIIKKEVPQWGGMNYLEANPLINEELKKRGLLYSETPHTHSIPLCWRCRTRLYYAPYDAWYVDVQQLKERMKKTNEDIYWFPDHFKHGRFLKSMEAAPDWCISRNRYFGSPVPVWECACGERFVPGSVKELEERSGQKVKDLHRPAVDNVVVTCIKCGKRARRVSEVLDSWIEAASAPWAQVHYPFNKQVKLPDFFPPDFIAEYTGQIRAWFYVLHVVANAIFSSFAFKNVVVTGVILGDDGRKMSKNYHNYPDPREMLLTHGGDALRLYLLSSPVMKGEDVCISEKEYKDQVRGMLLILWNVYKFFITYASSNKWSPLKKAFKPTHILDRWILSRLWGMTKNVNESLEQYDVSNAVNHAHVFINDLSKWYVRRIRERVAPHVKDIQDKKDAYQTLWEVLVQYTKVFAPFAPFISEEIYKNLTNETSVHLSDWPYTKETYASHHDKKLENEMNQGIQLASAIHALRKKHTIAVRIPLNVVSYSGPFRIKGDIERVVLEEVNVKVLMYAGEAGDITIPDKTADKSNQDTEMGTVRELIRSIQLERKAQGLAPTDLIAVTLPDYPQKFADLIKQKVMAKEIQKGEKLMVKKIP